MGLVRVRETPYRELIMKAVLAVAKLLAGVHELLVNP